MKNHYIRLDIGQSIKIQPINLEIVLSNHKDDSALLNIIEKNKGTMTELSRGRYLDGLGYRLEYMGTVGFGRQGIAGLTFRLNLHQNYTYKVV